MQPRIIAPDHLQVVFQDSVIGDVKTGQGRVWPDISLSDVFAKEAGSVCWIAWVLFKAIKGFEIGLDMILVGYL